MAEGLSVERLNDGKPCPDCDVPTMLALSPLHPRRYAELACPAHRNASPSSVLSFGVPVGDEETDSPNAL